jgi:hypothetical protein
MWRCNIALSRAELLNSSQCSTSSRWIRNRGIQIPRLRIPANEEFFFVSVPWLRAIVSTRFEVVAARLQLRGNNIWMLDNWLLPSFGLAWGELWHSAIKMNLSDIMLGVQPQISTAQNMGRTAKDGPAHKITACGSRHSSEHVARHLGDILKIAKNLLRYAECNISCKDYLLPH